ncbi:hypothetical protein ACQ86N_36715 [Puia sp. P3]|uniref:hypothetical protein n=1 Tax=Puia sp. P3 TaxID=3423952 RepID=UPI003D66EECB
MQDFEIVYARKPSASDYYFNPQVGFLSVNQTLQSNDVLAVAYQYSYNGQIYQVGEFAADVPPIPRSVQVRDLPRYYISNC